MNKYDRGANGSNGSKWIRRDKRLAIYLRDDLACVWCKHAIEDGAQLTLDHLDTGHANHHESNLITACLRCNSSRAGRSVETFALAVAGYVDHGVTADAIISEIAYRAATDLQPFREQAKQMIACRGSYRAAMQSCQH